MTRRHLPNAFSALQLGEDKLHSVRRQTKPPALGQCRASTLCPSSVPLGARSAPATITTFPLNFRSVYELFTTPNCPIVSRGFPRCRRQRKGVSDRERELFFYSCSTRYEFICLTSRYCLLGTFKPFVY